MDHFCPANSEIVCGIVRLHYDTAHADPIPFKLTQYKILVLSKLCNSLFPVFDELCNFSESMKG